MLRKPKLIALCISFIMVLTMFSACNKGEKSSSTGTGSKPQEITVIKAMYMDQNWKIRQFGDDPGTKQFMEKTGVKLEFSVPQGDWQQIANVMLVSNDYPALMWMNRGPVYEKYIASGALRAVDELAKKYNSPKLIGDYIPEKVVKYLKAPDGHLYIIPNWFSDDGFGSVGSTLSVRKDIYEDMGKPDLKTIDDYYKYLVKIRDANLKYQGIQVYPMGMNYDLSWISHTSNLWGSQIFNRCFYDEKDKKVKFMLRNETVLEAIKFLNKCYRDKLIDPEVFTNNVTKRNEAYAQGKYATIISDFWNLWTANSALSQKDPRVYYESKPAMQGIPGKTPHMAPYQTPGGHGALITKNAKENELAKIMKWFDYYMSPEGNILSFYGVEGQTLEFKNGVPYLMPGVYEAKLADWEGYGFKTGVRKLDLNQNQKYNWERRQEAPERQANRKIATNSAFDGTALYVLTVDPTTQEGILLADIETGMLNELTKMITTGDPGGIDKMYNNLLADYERRGLEKLEKVWTDKYLAREK